MQSPKFSFLRKELLAAFAVKLLKEDWKNRVKLQIRKQILLDPIEYRDYQNEIDDLVTNVRNEIVSGSYNVRPPKRYLVEKSMGLCRMMTLVHPRDLLVLERLSKTIYSELKLKAPSKNAYFEPDDGNFKKAFSNGEHSYGSYLSWKKFQKAVFNFAKESEFIVVTDVANFYDFINFQHLRNVIASLADVRESTLDLIIYVLNRLTWTPDYMPLTQVGMPQIETSATRVLANAMLYEVDNLCESMSVSNYARFMDDIDAGVGSFVEAQTLVRDVDLTLQSRQLRLNSSKTKILTKKEAYSYFCIRQNLVLSRIEAISSKIGSKKFAARFAKSYYELWLKRDATGGPGKDSCFQRSNGSKIHKWILRLIYDNGERVPDNDLIWLIKNSAGMRSTAFIFLAKTSTPNSALQKIYRLVLAKNFIDDAGKVYLSNWLLHSKFRKTSKSKITINSIIGLISNDGDIPLQSAIMMSSKYSSPADIMNLLNKHKDKIGLDFWLSRAAAGIAPVLFDGGVYQSNYVRFIRNLKSEEAERVLSYHLDLMMLDIKDKSTLAYLKAENPTYPLGIYYPKLLSILSFSKNPLMAATYTEVRKKHKAITSDPYIAAMGF